MRESWNILQLMIFDQLDQSIATPMEEVYRMQRKG